MQNFPAETMGRRYLLLKNSKDVDWENAVDVLRNVFALPLEDAEAMTRKIHREGQVKLGPYPQDVAEVLVAAASRHGSAESQKVDISILEIDDREHCSFCGKLTGDEQHTYRGGSASICQDCLATGLAQFQSPGKNRPTFGYAFQAIAWHFAGFAKNMITSTTRSFPGHMRADVQTTVNALFTRPDSLLFGIHEEHRYETLSVSKLMAENRQPSMIAQAEYEDLDIGNATPVKCLRNGLWLLRDGEMPCAVVMAEHREFDQEMQIRVEIATPKGEQGAAFSARCFTLLEEEVQAARSYRGKVLSFEPRARYRGESGGMMVHRLPTVSRDDVILSDATLALLDRNIVRFVESREQLRALGQPTRKGILLYGPPGTGKTHTIRYLANNLPGHTTLLITAEQVAKLKQYTLLARLLQPSMVVIEDVDLIARRRENMNGPCEESMLNELLNEMDGLKGDADIIFVLTTNRPEQLEEALAGRPGRVDQAIEIPLPDIACREQLIRLYGGKLNFGPELTTDSAARTEGMSAAFIKELMRRIAQAMIGRADEEVTVRVVKHAMDDMLFSGGQLNARLLGANPS